MKKVAIIIVNWDGERLLKTCLEAVYEQAYKNFEVYFVDNGSEDNSVEFVKKNFPKVKIIRLKENTGFAKGNNVGIGEALEDKEIEHIVCLNNDTKVDKNWLAELVKSADKNKQVGMVASKAFFPDEKIQSAGIYIQSKDLKSSGGISRGFDEKANKFNQEELIFAPSGCSALYKRKALEEAGLFDEDFFAYSEDHDLGMRIQLMGWKCLYNPKSQLVHYHSKTSGGVGSPFKAFYTKRNGLIQAVKNYSSKDIFQHILNDFKFYLSCLKKDNQNKSVFNLKKKVGLKGTLLIILKIYWSFLIHLPKTLVKRRKIQKTKRINKEEYKKLFIDFSK
jgi:GT2 family glycosyltransferase